MDLKLKGKSWAGNIYHQFESICQDVDDFMSKDTVKLVENKMQNVGISVKRFYSNVVQDILPLSADIVRPKSQSVDGEQVDTSDHVNPIAGVRTNPARVNEKQLSVNQGSFDTSRNCDMSLPNEVDHVTLYIKPHHADSSRETETYPHLRKDDDAIIRNDSVEAKITKDSIPVISSASFESEILTGNSDGHKNSTLTMASSPAFSAHEEGSITIEKERRVFNQQKGKEGFLDDEDCLSNISSSGWLCESNLTMVEDPNSDENRSLCAPSIDSFQKVNEDNSLMMDPPLPSACDAAHRPLGKDGTLSDTFSTKDESFDLSSSVQSPDFVFSYFSCDEEEEEEEEERAIMHSTHSTSPNIIKEAENVCHSRAESNGCVYNISTPSSTTATYETNSVDVLPAFLILESNDSVSGSSDKWHEQPYKDGQSDTTTSPSETGNICEFGVDIGDLNMETVDLSPDVKRDGRNVVLNANFVHDASHRRKNFRYYKKLIQDAFTSQKRLSKEYEHLAILYGDIDMESSQHFDPSAVPFSPNTSIHALGTQSFQEIHETEWELL